MQPSAPQFLIRSDLPRISIVTPSFNQSEFLEACMDSILSQGYPNLEYIVMDGGSTDGSVDIIKKFEKHLTFWQSCPDDGHYAAVNAGLQKTTGEVMGWLNSDDMLHLKGLFVLGEVFLSHQEIEFVTGRRVGFDRVGNIVPHWNQRKRWCRDFLLDERNLGASGMYVMQESTYWRRSLWNRSGGALDLNFKLAADFELWARFFRSAELFTINETTGGFRSHGDEQRSQKYIENYIEECLTVIERERSLIIEQKESFSKPPKVLPSPFAPMVTRKPRIPILPDRSKYAFQFNPEYPKISIVIDAMGGTELIDRCLDSILSQRWPNLECIVVLYQNSPQHTANLLPFREYVTIREVPKNYSHAQGIEDGFLHSSGAIMNWVVADDIFQSTTLQVVAELFHRRPDISWITGRPYQVNQDGEFCNIMAVPAIYARQNFLKGNYSEPFVQHETIFWRRTLWNQAGGKLSLNTNISLAYDFELWLRFSRFAKLATVNFLFGGTPYEAENRYENLEFLFYKEARELIAQENRQAPSPFDNDRAGEVIVSL